MTWQERLEIKERLSVVIYQKHHAGSQLIIAEKKVDCLLCMSVSQAFHFLVNIAVRNSVKTFLFPCLLFAILLPIATVHWAHYVHTF